MTENNARENQVWPMIRFIFAVDFGTDLKNIAFQEVSGMDTETQVIEYRKSNNPEFSAAKMPGITKYGNVTLKRGVFINNDAFRSWHNRVTMNTISRTTVTIKLLDESGNAAMQWQLHNAWPTKITATDLRSGGNEVAIDTLEIAYEQLTITKGK